MIKKIIKYYYIVIYYICTIRLFRNFNNSNFIKFFVCRNSMNNIIKYKREIRAIAAKTTRMDNKAVLFMLFAIE
jgi:hypothetical protein